jgi:putative endonuclease
MPHAYVLRSRTTGRHYTGATTNLKGRLEKHNSDQSISTKHRGPWELIHCEEFATLAEALRRERFFKTGKGRDELKRILQLERAQLDRGRRGDASNQ